MPATPVSISWLEIATLAGSAGIATAIATNIIGWWRESQTVAKTMKRDATYLAMRLAVILEGFAIECEHTIGENNLYDDSRGNAGSQKMRIPDLYTYPTDVDLKSLESSLAARALSFHNELSLCRRSIMGTIDVVGPEAAFDECSRQSGKSGYIAWTLAADLRKHYSLPSFDPKQTAWDIMETLKEYHDKVNI